MDLRAVRMVLVLGLVGVASNTLPPAGYGVAAADWEVRRDPFDANVIAKYKQMLVRDPHDTALATLLSMYKRFRTVETLAKEYSGKSDWASLVVMGRLRRAMNDNPRARLAWTQAVLLRHDDARTWVLLGELDRATGKYATSRAAFDRARAYGSPAIAKQALLVLVELAAAAGDHTSADTYYRELLERDPKNAKLWIAHGDAMLGAQRPEAALASYTTAEANLALDPARRVEVIARRGDAFAKLGREVEALAEFARAAKLSPAYEAEVTDRMIAIHRHQHTLDQLVMYWETKWPVRSRHFVHWRTLADLYDEIGDHEKAITALETATQISFGELALERRLLALYDATGRSALALARYELLAKRLPREPTFQIALARRYWPSRDDKAIATLERLATQMKDDIDVLVGIAALYSTWSRHDLAIPIYEKAAKLDSQYLVSVGEQYAILDDGIKLQALVDRLAKQRDGAAIAKLGQVLLDRALWSLANHTFRIGVDVAPDMAVMWGGRASALEGLEHWEDAAASAEQALKHTSSDRKLRHQARHQLVRTVLRARADARWFAEWTEAYAKDDIDAGYLIAEYLAYRPCSMDPEMGCSLNELAETLEKLIKLVPDDPEPRKELARALRRDREYERAIVVYEELIPLVPDQKQELTKRIGELREEIRKRDEMAKLRDDDVGGEPEKNDASIQRLRTGLRVGIGSGFTEETRRIVRFSSVTTLALGEERETALVGRIDIAQRDSNEAAGIFGFGLGIASRVATTRKWMVLAGLAGRAERFGGSDGVAAEWQLAADFSLDLTSRATPFGLALHVDPRITGPAGATAMLELAVELR